MRQALAQTPSPLAYALLSITLYVTPAVADGTIFAELYLTDNTNELLQMPFGRVPPSRQQVDGNAQAPPSSRVTRYLEL